MVSRVVFLLSIFTSHYALSEVSFPAGCPGENLKKTCEALASIPSEKVVVFADGSEMPACFLHTANPPRSEESQKREAYLNRYLAHRLTEIYSETEIEVIMASISSPIDLRPVFRNDPNGMRAISELVALNSQVRPARRKMAKDISADFEFAKKEITEVLKKAPYENAAAKIKQVNTFDEIEYIPLTTAEPLPCRPKINAFYFADSRRRHQTLTVLPAVTQYPPFTRMRILGHELAHGFDPCQEDFSEEHPFKKLIRCLQKDFDDFKKSFFSGKCDVYTREAFADAFGIYVAERWQKSQPPKPPVKRESDPQKIYLPPGYENIIFDLDTTCREVSGDFNSDGKHPTMKSRFQDITLRNPTVAKSLNCRSDDKTPRCDIEQGFKGEERNYFERLIEKYKSNR